METWICCGCLCRFVLCHSSGETLHYADAYYLSCTTFRGAAEKTLALIFRLLSCGSCSGGLHVALQKTGETVGNVQSRQENLWTVDSRCLAEDFESRSWSACLHSHPCSADQGIAGSLCLTSQEQQDLVCSCEV